MSEIVQNFGDLTQKPSKFDYSNLNEVLVGGVGVKNPLKPSALENQKYQEEKEKLAYEKAKITTPVKKSMTLIHIGLFVGGLAVGYFAYKKFKK
jgi:hypothetical protein